MGDIGEGSVHEEERKTVIVEQRKLKSGGAPTPRQTGRLSVARNIT
jgi:hypothetical protein